MFLFEKNGVCIDSGKQIFVDAFGLRDSSVLISHAHSDHFRLSESNTYFMTEQTFALADSKKKPEVKLVPFGKKFDVEGFEVSMHPSGHILGSSQFKVCNGMEAVVTSDFKLQKSLLFEPAEILPCDTLLIESTFGLPEFSFPSREKVYDDMKKWAEQKLAEKSFVVFGGYATGKAQELTKFCNEFLGIVPLVHKKVFEKNTLAEKAGLKLGRFIGLDHNMSESQVLILPPQLINSFMVEALSMQLSKKVEAAIATGWKRFSGFKTFPLSDHADYGQLMQYVKESNPKMVLTHHGFDVEFAAAVSRELKIPAKALRNASQKTLSECFN